MRWQYSLKHLLILTALVALGISAGMSIYSRALVPYREITWSDCTVQEIKTAPSSAKQVILVCGNPNITSNFGRWRYELETPEFRVLMHHHGAKCFHCLPSRELDPYFQDLGLSEPVLPYVIVKNGKHTAVHPLDWEHAMRGTIDAIEQELRNPKSKQREW